MDAPQDADPDQVAPQLLFAEMVLDAIHEHASVPLPCPEQSQVHIRRSLAGMARCYSNLRATIVLHDEGLDDVLGLHLRNLFEAVTFSLLAIWGTEEHLQKVDDDDQRWLNQIPGSEEWAPSGGEGLKRYGLLTRVKAVDGLRAGRAGYADGWLESGYDAVYRLESSNAAHMGPSSLGRYLRPEDGTVNIDFAPDEHRTGRVRIGIAAYLLAKLAQVLWDELGLDGADFSDLATYYEERGDGWA